MPFLSKFVGQESDFQQNFRESQVMFKKKMRKDRIVGVVREAQSKQQMANLQAMFQQAQKSMRDQMYQMLAQLMG